MNENNNIPILNIKDSETGDWIPVPAIKGTSVGVTIASATRDSRSGTLVTLLDEGKKILDPSYTGDIFFVSDGIDGIGAVKTVDSQKPDGNGEVSLSAVRYVAQSLSSDSKTQARINIGALAANASYSVAPIMDGTASPGSSSSWARGDHVHPTDTSRASVVELATYTRPNLLDNWYFVGGGSQLGSGIFPINQRGQTSYSNTGYTIDRWYISSNPTVTVGSDYVNFTSGQVAVYQQLRQWLSQDLPAGTYTLSMLAKVNSIGGTVWFCMSDENHYIKHAVTLDAGTGYRMFTTTFTLTEKASGWSVRLVTDQAETNYINIDMKAWKLEIGSTQTLAHQENGAWVLNEIPNWSEQFYLCTIAEKNGILKAAENGTIIPAVAGTDYVVPTALSAKQDKITTSGILKGNGSGGVSEAVAGTDYLTPTTNYSPIRWITAPTYNISSSDIGATISVAFEMRNTPLTVNLTQAVSSTLPSGTEIAIINYFNANITLTVSGIQVGVNGIEGDIADTKLFYSSTPHSFKPGAIYSMMALKKISGDTTHGDCWLLTGNVEVVS